MLLQIRHLGDRMENMTDLGEIIDVSEYQKYIDASATLPHVEKKYGDPYRIPNYPCWMDYGNPSGGSISFTRHTYSHPVLREMCDKIAIIVRKLLPKSTIYPERVHIIKTVKSVPAHRDEGGRMTCINFGIRNSSKAITKFSNDDNFETFNTNHTVYTVKDGHGYLVNVAVIHSVVGTDDERYLITYGTEELYKSLLEQVNFGK